jgi:hypothetical protein
MASKKFDKVVFEYPVKEIHGKPCRHTDVYFAKNKFSEKNYMSRLCNPNKNWSASQLAKRQLFSESSAYAKAQMADATKRTAAELRFAAQTKYKTLRTYLMVEFMMGNGVE